MRCLKAVPGAPVLPDVRLGRKVADNTAGCTHVLKAPCCARPGCPLAPTCPLAWHEPTEDDQAIKIQAFYSSSPAYQNGSPLQSEHGAFATP